MKRWKLEQEIEEAQNTADLYCSSKAEAVLQQQQTAFRTDNRAGWANA